LFRSSAKAEILPEIWEATTASDVWSKFARCATIIAREKQGKAGNPYYKILRAGPGLSLLLPHFFCLPNASSRRQTEGNHAKDYSSIVQPRSQCSVASFIAQ
jgi:hypothetical protein